MCIDYNASEFVWFHQIIPCTKFMRKEFISTNIAPNDTVKTWINILLYFYNIHLHTNSWMWTLQQKSINSNSWNYYICYKIHNPSHIVHKFMVAFSLITINYLIHVILNKCKLKNKQAFVVSQYPLIHLLKISS